MREYKDIILEIDHRIATLTLNMPDTRNSISGQGTIEEIEAACRQVQYDDEVSWMSLTGAGQRFSLGANVQDIPERATGTGGSEAGGQWGSSRVSGGFGHLCWWFEANSGEYGTKTIGKAGQIQRNRSRSANVG